MSRVGTGDPAACRMLVDRHLPRIVAFSRRMLGNQADAEDVAQEVFLRVWAKAAEWRPGSARLTTWLHTVALNLCRDRLRRKRPEPLDGGIEPADPSPDATMLLAREEVATRVDEALACIPGRQREAIVLCHYQGLSNAAAAEILGVGVEAVESLLARGRRALRRQLAPLAGDLIGGTS